MSAEAKARTAQATAPSVDSSLGTKLLPSVLSVTAGSVDAISFLGLGLFTAHVTGNLVILAAHVVSGRTATLPHILAVPVFMTMLGVARLLAAALEAFELASLRPLLVLQFLLLAGFLAVGVAAGPRVDRDAPSAILAGMLGVAAMAVQNALVQISLRGAPSTAVMTTNITRFTMDVGTVLFGRDPRQTAGARARAEHTWLAIIGFAAGCALGAACEARFGLWSLGLPAGFALLAVGLGFWAKLDEVRPS